MCILVTIPRAEFFPFHVLKAMLAANNDGAGIAWFDRKAGKSHVRKFLTTLTPRHEPEFPADLEDRGTPDLMGIIPERLAKLNGWRVKQGKSLHDSESIYYDDSCERYLDWLSGGSLVRSKKTVYHPPRTVTFVDESEVIRAVKRIPLDSPMIFHARLCTHGDVSLDNCHPFKIPKSHAILAHNGTISGMGDSSGSGWTYYSGKVVETRPRQGLSDTRELAESYLSGWSYAEIVRAKRLIEHVGGWSKFAVMDGTTGEITHMGTWAHTDSDGVAYSNLNFMPRKA